MQEPARDHLRLVERADAKHEIGLAAGKTVEPRVGQELDTDARVQPAEFGQNRRQHQAAEPIRRRDPEKTVELRLRARQAPLEGERLLLHPLGVGQHRRALVSQHEAFGRALKQRLAHGRFERRQAASHGRLRQAEPARGRAERALARDGEEDPQVAPLHARPFDDGGDGHQTPIQN